MNVIFLSPHFPPSYRHFCRALRERGARVLAIADAEPRELGDDLRPYLTDYVKVTDLGDYDAVLRAVGLFVHRHGRIDHIDSLNEHWLETEAKLRLDFNVEGAKSHDLQELRSKSLMAERLLAKGLRPPETHVVHAAKDALEFAARVGYPVIVKPDVGVGAELTTDVGTAAELERLLEERSAGFVIQELIRAPITTYDGLTDRDGRVVHASSLIYNDGVMQIRKLGLDVFFYTRRTIPAALEAAGQAILEAFDFRGRFFHIELFELPDGTYRPLEINGRPPGGFTIDIMNYACDADLFALWADVVTYSDTSAFHAEAKYHAAHVSRRPWHAYKYSESELPALLGPALVAKPDMPTSIGEAMGMPLYILRHEDERELRRLAGLILAAV